MNPRRAALVLFLIITVTCSTFASCNFSGLTGPVNAPLMVAIWRGDIGAVSKLLNSTPSLDIKFQFCGRQGEKTPETTPLVNAVQANFQARTGEGHMQMLEYLLNHGASPNFPLDGFTPLHMAAAIGNLPAVKLLLRYGASVDPVYGDETPLLLAVQNGYMPVIKELIAAGANFELHDSLGGNLVSVAANHHDEEVVKLLIQLGVDPCAKDHDGNDAIYWAGFGNDSPAKLATIKLLKAECGLYD
jgi:ankyrin repeat protein